MEAFQGVFAKRGEQDVTLLPTTTGSTGAFEDVFVRRGRWRKNAAEAHEQTETIEDDDAARQTKSAKQSAVASTFMTLQNHDFIVKNTFVDASAVDFDSLRDFLKERKVQSCPASRQGSSVTEQFIDDLLAGAESGFMEGVLNTASSLGDIPFLLSAQKEETEHLDDASSMPSGSTKSGQATPSEEVFNTASTFSDSDLEVLQQSTAASSDDVKDQSSSSEDRLASLRMKGSAIQDSMRQVASQKEPQLVPALQNGSATTQQLPAPGPNQWIVAVQTPEGIRPGVVTLLPTPPPSEPPLITPRLSEPATCPPPPAPVLQLAEAISPPQVGTEELPSIGSLLHHTGECKPCTFFYTRGCENAENCKFCHLCGRGEKKKRLKAQKAAQREANFVALENAKAMLATFRAAEENGLQVETIVE